MVRQVTTNQAHGHMASAADEGEKEIKFNLGEIDTKQDNAL